MPRTWFVCLMIVAAFTSPLCAAAVAATVMAPVSEPVLAVARTFGLEPAHDRVRFLPDLVRLTHAGPVDRTTALDALRRADPHATASAATPLSAERVVVPLDAAVWSRAIFKRPVTADQLLTAIVLDRRAALLAHGLAQMDDETLTAIAQTPLLLADLYEHAAPAFAAFAQSVRVRDGRVVMPGGPGDQALWEAVVNAPANAPERVMRQLFEPPGGGRLAYFYALAAGLDAARLRFLLGPASLERPLAIERLRALADLAQTQYGDWRVDTYPFARPPNDLTMLLMRLQVDASGRPLPPADLDFWSEVWGDAPSATVAASATAKPATTFDAAWLATRTGFGNLYERGDRLDQIAFAQRVFAAGATSARVDAVAALRALPRQKMLMLTLERMGFRTPALFAAVAKQAAQLDVGDATRGFWVMSQVQPAMALVARMTMSGTFDRTRAERLVRSLFAVPLDDHQRYNGGIVRWMARDLLPLLPSSTDADTSVMLALAGPSPAASDRARSPRVEWEGERYRVDFQAAELRRLQAVRDKQGGPTIEFAIAIERLASRLAAPTLDDDGLTAAQKELQTIVAVHGLELPSASALPDIGAAGVSAPRRLRDTVERLSADITQEARAHDVRRASRHVAALHELADTLAGEALLSMAYAADLGDPDGPALLSRNAALRHDFGFGRLDADVRGRVTWAVPRQDFQPGIPWHVTGSALGLDIALARLALTRINSDRLAGAPRITSIDRDGFAVGFTLLDRRTLRDDMRDAIATALTRGRSRVAAAVAGREPLDRLADVLNWDGLRRRSLSVRYAEAPARVVDLFTLVELVQLGDGPALEALAPWGANAMPLTGCPCTQVWPTSAWRLLGGRQQLALAAAVVPDLNFRIAEALADLRLPAVLARPVLAAAVQDFLEDASPTDGGDWWSLSEAARAVSRERIEDYVAAVASVGGALIPDDDFTGAQAPD